MLKLRGFREYTPRSLFFRKHKNEKISGVLYSSVGVEKISVS
jgi:hypothetical protein